MNYIRMMKDVPMLLTLAISITACSSKPEVKEFPKSANSKQEMINLEAALENSTTEEYGVLAPVSYQEAQKSLQEAKDMETEGKDNEKILKKVALGNAFLERAKSKSEDNRAKIPEILAARQDAIKAKVKVYFPADFSKVDDKLKEETADLEKGNSNKMKERRSEFITSYSDLELSAIKHEHLGASRILIDESIANGAYDLTPRTLVETNKKFSEADLYITQNRHDTAGIELRSADLLREAKNLESTTLTARGVSASTPEQTALKMQAEEDRLNKGQMAQAKDQETISALTASNADLSKDQKLNAIYEEARTKFEPNEAEVYKQGNNLVIRLRALEFATAQSAIKSDKFALLKKVEDVIGSFENSAVIVEGHTDSIGGKNVNQRLSNKRAEAVKHYLEVNSEDKISEIEAKGFGDEKPLASNKTPEGRAQNRRVDIIIGPAEQM